MDLRCEKYQHGFGMLFLGIYRLRPISKQIEGKIKHVWDGKLRLIGGRSSYVTGRVPRTCPLYAKDE